MRKNEMLQDILNDIEIPQELLPENIAIMLENSKKSRKHIHKKQNASNIKVTSQSYERKKAPSKTSSKPIKVSSHKSSINRTVATIAACFIVIAGLAVFMKNSDNESIAPVESSKTDHPDVTTSQGSYKEVYDTLKKVYVSENKENKLAAIINQVKQEEEIEEYNGILSKSYNSKSVLNVDNVSSVVTAQNSYITPKRFLSDGETIYCAADDSVYFISSDNGQLTLIKQITRDNITPVGMYLKDSNLIVLSEITTIEDKVSIPTTNTEETNSDTSDTTTTVESEETAEDNLTDETSNSEDTSDAQTETDEQEETSQTEIENSDSSDIEIEEQNDTENDESELDTQATTSVESSSEETTKATTSVVDNSSYEKVTVKTMLAEVYDITDSENPVLVNEIRQDGRYISSTMNGNNLYIASGYKDNKNKIIKSEEDIENYVPSYESNGNKDYILAENIISSENITNANYVVITCIDMLSVSPVKNAVALLGFADDVTFRDGILYAYENIYNEETQNTIITKFNMDYGNIILDPQSVTVNGIIKDINSVNENEGYLSVVSSVYDNKKETFSNGIYIFSEDLEQVGSLAGFGDENLVTKVSFKDTTVYCKLDDEDNTVIAIDCSDPSTPLIFNDAEIKGSIPLVYDIGNNNFIAIGITKDEMEIPNGVEISVYQNDEDNNEYIQKSSLCLDEEIIDPEINPNIKAKIIYIDKDTSQFGISVSYNNGIDICNKFYMVKYTENGLECIGEPVVCNDLSDIYQFNSSFTNEDKLYIISEGRIVCVDINAMTILGNLSLVTPYED